MTRVSLPTTEPLLQLSGGPLGAPGLPLGKSLYKLNPFLFLPCFGDLPRLNQTPCWGKPSVEEGGGWGGMRHMWEQWIIPRSSLKPTLSDIFSFGNDTMRCTHTHTHTLIRCVTNEGVLTFRCFPLEPHTRCVHGERNSGFVCTFFELVQRPRCKYISVCLWTWPTRQGFILQSKQKASWEATAAGVIAVQEAKQAKPQRNTWDVCEMFVLSLLWFEPPNHLSRELLQFHP